MEDSIIYQSIIELSKDKSYENIILNYDDFINLTKSNKGFFGTRTKWSNLTTSRTGYITGMNNLKNKIVARNAMMDAGIAPVSSVNLEDEILFIFKSGVIFTKTGIFGIIIDNLNYSTEFNSFYFLKYAWDVYPFEAKQLKYKKSSFHNSLAGKSNLCSEFFDENGGIKEGYIKKAGLAYDSRCEVNFLKIIEPNILLMSGGTDRFKIKNPDDFQEIKLENGVFTHLENVIGGEIEKSEAVLLNEKEVQFFKELDKLVNKKREELIQSRQKEEEQRILKLNSSVKLILKELDKDGNGEVDVIEGNDFNLLLKKHYKSILEINRDYIQKFIKVSSYLKTKKENIQSIFDSIKDIPDEELLNEYIEILKGNINSYNLLLYHSLNMISSLVEDDMSFYEIYEAFDNLNMFDSKWERDVSQKLLNIGDGLKNLMSEVRKMSENISAGLSELTYATEQTNDILDNRLSEIDSSIQANTLITLINTYQSYKINKNTKSLR